MRIECSQRIGESSAWRAVAFVDDHLPDLGSNLIGIFIKSLDKSNGYLFAYDTPPIADYSHLIARDT